MKKIKPFSGISAFVMVLLTMPLGHAAVILLQSALGEERVVLAGFLLGLAGAGLLLAGLATGRELIATFLGLFGGLFVWAGWIEIGFQYYANRLGIEPLMQHGEVITRAEYLLMPSSAGFFAVFMFYYLFGVRSGCRFFLWFQRLLRIDRWLKPAGSSRNPAMVTFMEMMVLLWGFYLLLLFAYDEQLAGDRHPLTYVIAFGSLLWSVLLFGKLLKINNLAYAIRYAIPVVLIFWNFVEILGRWQVFTEIWIDPSTYMLEMALMALVLLILTATALFSVKRESGWEQ